jgi:hypothetical protein
MGTRWLASVKLFMCKEVKSVCREAIANSGANQFCIRGQCDVKSHRINKVFLKEDHLYIIGKRKDQALVNLTLDASALPGDVDPQELVEIARPINIWRAHFTSETERNKRVDGSEKFWEEAEDPALSKLIKVDTAHQTPKKLKVGALLEALADTIPVGVGKSESIQVIEDHMGKANVVEQEATRNASLREALAEWNKVCV